MRFRTALGLFCAVALTRADAPQSEMQLVDLTVIALDNHGQPVTDLTRDDFQVTDSGKAQPVVFFRHNDAKLWQAPSLQPDEFSNRRGANVPRATIILLDYMNQSFSTRGVSTNNLIKALEPLESADYLYLYILTLEGRLFAVHGLPQNEGAVEPLGQTPWTRNIKQVLEQATRDVMRVRPPDVDVAIRTQLTFRALEGLAADLSAMRGRKNIVWVTDGVPITLGPIRSDTGDFVDFTPLIRRLSAAMDRSDIAIYPVRQVMLGSQDEVADNPGGQEGGRGGVSSIDTLDQFAGLTGGRPDGGKDIGAAIHRAMADLEVSYQIGYYPPQRNWDGKFHKLRVICKRKGVRLQTKTGYYAFPEPPGTRAEQALQMAASTTFDAAEIGLRASLLPDPKDKSVAHLQAHINAGDVVLIHEGDQYTAQLRVALVNYGTDGRAMASQLMPLDLHYTAQQRDQVLKEGIPFTSDVPLGANLKGVRAVVFDRGSDTVGSVTIPIKAP